MKKTTFHIAALLLICIAFSGCTEPYALQTNTFEEALVIEGTITNELKQQEIKISRTFKFEQNGPVFETDATVTVLDDDGNEYAFEENDGKYISEVPFEAIPGRTYRLNIVTKEGKTYLSTHEELTAVNDMESVVAAPQIKNGIRGVGITVNSFDPQGNSKYYRYEYEETYKILTPHWDPEKAILLPPLKGSDHPEIGTAPRDNMNSKVCYSSANSIEIIQTSTIGLSEDRVNFVPRFISIQDPIIQQRYSILVRQYVQSLQAYTFYKTLKQLSGNGSILSQRQPGFFYGNLRCLNNPNEKVIGFFEVSSVSSKRIFFNFVDLFPGEPLPPYFQDCDIKELGFCFIPTIPACRGAQLIGAISTNSLLYAGHYYDSQGGYDVYRMVSPPCGDCTKFSSNVIPSFWIE